ncbi:MAG: hypothetical protein DIJKHBIC_00550 [Thermoanaerobaculia bacterium]|nr:hypothetical protein [Thermoanaerobaculia bacterium]
MRDVREGRGNEEDLGVERRRGAADEDGDVVRGEPELRAEHRADGADDVHGGSVVHGLPGEGVPAEDGVRMERTGEGVLDLDDGEAGEFGVSVSDGLREARRDDGVERGRGPVGPQAAWVQEREGRIQRRGNHLPGASCAVRDEDVVRVRGERVSDEGDAGRCGQRGVEARDGVRARRDERERQDREEDGQEERDRAA